MKAGEKWLTVFGPIIKIDSLLPFEPKISCSLGNFYSSQLKRKITSEPTLTEVINLIRSYGYQTPGVKTSVTTTVLRTPGQSSITITFDVGKK